MDRALYFYDDFSRLPTTFSPSLRLRVLIFCAAGDYDTIRIHSSQLTPGQVRTRPATCGPPSHLAVLSRFHADVARIRFRASECLIPAFV